MDEAPPPAPPPDRSEPGRLTRDRAVALLERGGELLASGDYAEAGPYFSRVVGFDDPTITAAALLGLGEAHYRLNDEAAAVASWEAVLQLPETPSTYTAWRNVAAARVRDGDLTGAITAYREADKRAPAEDKAEIANRLGWLTKETGDTQGGRPVLRQGSRRLSADHGHACPHRRDDHRVADGDVRDRRPADLRLAPARQDGGRGGGVLAAVDGDAAPFALRPAPPHLQHVRAVAGRHDRRALVRAVAVPRLLPRLRRGRVDRRASCSVPATSPSARPGPSSGCSGSSSPPAGSTTRSTGRAAAW